MGLRVLKGMGSRSYFTETCEQRTLRWHKSRATKSRERYHTWKGSQVMPLEPASTIEPDWQQKQHHCTRWMERGFSATLKSERQIWVIVHITYLKNSARAQDPKGQLKHTSVIRLQGSNVWPLTPFLLLSSKISKWGDTVGGSISKKHPGFSDFSYRSETTIIKIFHKPFLYPLLCQLSTNRFSTFPIV